MFEHAISLVLACALNTCAATHRVHVEPTYTAAIESTFRFDDARPPLARHRPVAQNGSAYFYRDDQFDPPPPIAIERVLRLANGSLDGAHVRLTRFDVSYTRTAIQHTPSSSYPLLLRSTVGAALVYLNDTVRSPDFAHAVVELAIDGVTVRAAASGPVSKYGGETGANALVSEMLEGLVRAVRERPPRTDLLQYPPLTPFPAAH